MVTILGKTVKAFLVRSAAVVTLDAFADAMRAIAQEAKSDPALVKSAPHDTPVRRVDEVKAARELILTDRAKLG